MGGTPWSWSLINEIDQSVATEVVLLIRCMAMACVLLFLQVRPHEIDQSVATEVVLLIRCVAMACMLLFLQVRPQHCIGCPPR